MKTQSKYNMKPNIKTNNSIIQQQLHMDQQLNQQSSSAYSSQDEDAYLLTDKVQEKILQTVAKLKAHHPSIYNIEKPIFQDNDFQSKQKKQSNKAKKYTYKDLVLKEEKQESQEQLPHALEQKKAKNLFKKAIQNQKQSEADLFTVKGKLTKNQNNKDKYQQLTQKFNPQSSKLIKRVWEDNSKMDDTDLFLKQYILNKKWLTTKYQKELGDHQKEFQKIDDEDQQRSLQIDQYQATYNFRFQEPQADKLVQYPRQIKDSLRIKPESRKQKRKKLQQRKRVQEQNLKMQAQKKEQLKNQIINKFQNTKQSPQFQNDWFFCDDCAKPFQEGETNFKCNQCQDYMLCSDCHDLIIHKHQLIKDKIPKGFGVPSKEIGQVLLQGLKNCMTCRRKLPQNLKRYQYKDRSFIIQTLCQKCYDESNLQTKKKFKEVKASNQNIQQLLSKDPQKVKQLTNSKDIEQMVQQYIKNDFQDIIGGGLKTKFKYLKVKPQSYGLSDEQILFGDDKQMNNYVSIKKLAPYRQGNLKLRNNIYNKKIKSIQRTVKQNKKLLQKEKGQTKIKKIRTIQKMKQRSSALKKKRQLKLRILNISDPKKEKTIFIPSSRLASYGLKNENN